MVVQWRRIHKKVVLEGAILRVVCVNSSTAVVQQMSNGSCPLLAQTNKRAPFFLIFDWPTEAQPYCHRFPIFATEHLAFDIGESTSIHLPVDMPIDYIVTADRDALPKSEAHLPRVVVASKYYGNKRVMS